MRTDNTHQPKVGFLVLGNPRLVSGIRKETLAELEKLPLTLCSADISNTIRDVLKAVLLFKANDVDVVLIYCPHFFNEDIVCFLANELSSYPLILWAVYTSSKTESLLFPIICAASNLKHLGKKFFILLGQEKDMATTSQILAIARAAMVAKKLRRSIVGQIGSPNLGMLDTGFSEFHMRQLVPNILHLDTLELLSYFEKSSEEEAFQLADNIMGRFGRVTVDRKEVKDAVKSYLAMKALVEKYGLNALTIRDWPELGEKNFTICLGCALLNDEGLVTVQEADIPSTITALALYYLNKSAPYVGEIVQADLVQNICVLSHEGAISFSLVDNLNKITLTHAVSVEKFHGRRSGVSVQGVAKPGRVTIAKIGGNPLNGSIKMIVTQGEVIKSNDSHGTGLSKVYVKPDIGVKQLIDTWIEEGFEHHIVLTYGNLAAELEALCDIWQIEKVVVG